MRFLLALALVAIAAPAYAHQSSIKYVDVTVDGAEAEVAITVAPADLVEPMQLPVDATPSAAQAIATPSIAPYVAGWVALALADGRACLAAAPHARPDPDGRFVVVAWRVACPDAIAALAFDFRRFFAIDQRHEAILTVHAIGEDGEPAIVRSPEPTITMRAGETQSLLAWVRLGMHHIYSGRDHISFVLALLLVVMLARGEAWELRSPLDTAKRTATIVTAFTIAHSLSLIAASLGWISLPGRFVESAIALSIAYTALENMVAPTTRYRYALAFGFGLVHGLGFASALEALLPPAHVIAPLLGFNVGVELGQLTIVLVALPIFYVCARALGAVRYRHRLMPVLSSVILVFGLNWLIARAFQISPPIPWTWLIGS